MQSNDSENPVENLISQIKSLKYTDIQWVNKIVNRIEKEENSNRNIRKYANFKNTKTGFKFLVSVIKENKNADIASLIATILLCKEACELKLKNNNDQDRIEKLTDACKRLKTRISSFKVRFDYSGLLELNTSCKTDDTLELAISKLLEKEEIQDFSDQDSLSKIEYLLDRHVVSKRSGSFAMCTLAHGVDKLGTMANIGCKTLDFLSLCESIASFSINYSETVLPDLTTEKHLLIGVDFSYLISSLASMWQTYAARHASSARQSGRDDYAMIYDMCYFGAFFVTTHHLITSSYSRVGSIAFFMRATQHFAPVIADKIAPSGLLLELPKTFIQDPNCAATEQLVDNSQGHNQL